MGEGVGVGIVAASCGWTGSARRTSGSAAAGAGTTGATLGAAVAVGVGKAGVVSAGGAVDSAGWACGAMTLPETVAVGDMRSRSSFEAPVFPMEGGDTTIPHLTIRTHGMVMPDHVPVIAGDVGGQKAFSFCFGYIQALLQTLRSEV